MSVATKPYNAVENAYFFTGELYKALKYSVKAHEFCNQALKYSVEMHIFTSFKIQCKNAYFFTGELYKALKYSVKAHECCNQALQCSVKMHTFSLVSYTKLQNTA